MYPAATGGIRWSSRPAAAGLSAEWLLGDMRRLPWQREFDAAFCFGNSFGYLDHPGTQAFLAALSGALKPGARFLLETGMTAESILPALKQRQWFQVDDILLLIDGRCQIAESCVEIEYTFIRNGSVDRRSASQSVYTVAEIRRLLEQAGLATLELYGTIDRQPFDLGSPRLLLLAQKS